MSEIRQMLTITSENAAEHAAAKAWLDQAAGAVDGYERTDDDEALTITLERPVVERAWEGVA